MPQGTQYRKHFRVTPAEGQGSQSVYPPTPTRHWLGATRDFGGAMTPWNLWTILYQGLNWPGQPDKALRQ